MKTLRHGKTLRQRLADQKVAVSVVFVLAMFISIMDVTIVNVALPQIGRDLHSGATDVAAVAIGYLVSLAVVIPASGWLGDRFGTKRVLLIAIVIFTTASALCGFAQTFGELVGFRVLQGIGGGMLTPVGMAMLFRAFPPAERVRASSILIVPTALAPAIGPVLGGLLVDDLSWRWVFFVNVPIGAIAFAFGLVFLREVDEPATGRFDVLGFILSGVGFAGLMYGVSEGPEKGWTDRIVLPSIAIGTVLIGLFVVTQLRTSQPLLNLRLFGDRLFRSATAGITVGTAAFLGMLYLAALFFQDGLGLSALNSGLSTFPEALGVMAGSQVASRVLYPRFGPRRLVVGGLSVVAFVLAAMALINRDQLWQMRGLMFAVGFAMSHSFVPIQAAAFARITPADTGRASTMFNALRQLGGAAGVAILTSALTVVGLTHRTGGRLQSNLHAYHVAFLVAAALAASAALIGLTIHDSDADSTRPKGVGARAAREPVAVD